MRYIGDGVRYRALAWVDTGEFLEMGFGYETVNDARIALRPIIRRHFITKIAVVDKIFNQAVYVEDITYDNPDSHPRHPIIVEPTPYKPEVTIK